MLSEQIPTSHIDRRLDVGMSFESRIHVAIELIDLRWILADKLGRKFGQTGPYARSIGWEIRWAKRARLPPSN